jgi:hypothetical protein
MVQTSDWYGNTAQLGLPNPQSRSSAQYQLLDLTANNYGAFTLDVKSVLNKDLGGILGGTQCKMVDNVKWMLT